jgi:hypothetical protein
MSTLESYKASPEYYNETNELEDLKGEIERKKEVLKSYIENIIEESISFNPLS